ncbi:hypothetical protein V9L05_18230 [Bernardetia sp. Wsw4-3y2]|uniref:hypothetical protein n=1 Tax=Bernardetia sp. Wsw4-3y2 TaxID=3127471 RepID=UPI0030CCCA87
MEQVQIIAEELSAKELFEYLVAQGEITDVEYELQPKPKGTLIADAILLALIGGGISVITAIIVALFGIWKKKIETEGKIKIAKIETEGKIKIAKIETEGKIKIAKIEIEAKIEIARNEIEAKIEIARNEIEAKIESANVTLKPKSGQEIVIPYGTPPDKIDELIAKVKKMDYIALTS